MRSPHLIWFCWGDPGLFPMLWGWPCPHDYHENKWLSRPLPSITQLVENKLSISIMIIYHDIIIYYQSLTTLYTSRSLQKPLRLNSPRSLTRQRPSWAMPSRNQASTGHLPPYPHQWPFSLPLPPQSQKPTNTSHWANDTIVLFKNPTVLSSHQREAGLLFPLFNTLSLTQPKNRANDQLAPTPSISNPKTKNDIQLHFTNHLYLSPEYHYTYVLPIAKPHIPEAAYSSSQIREYPYGAIVQSSLFVKRNQKSPVPSKSRYNRFSSNFNRCV